jgi:hypothetical protein
MGSSTIRTSDGAISSTAIFPITGKAWVSRVDFHCPAYFGFFHVGRRSSITRAAASAKVGTEGAGLRAVLGLPLFSERVPAFGHSGAVFGCQRTGFRQADDGVGSQSDVPAPIVDDDAKDP